MVRSIVGDWKVPIQTVLDQPVTKDILFELIKELEKIGILVIFIVSDQGPKNLGLAKTLGITPENVTFSMTEGGREIVFAYDWVHTFKNMR